MRRYAFALLAVWVATFVRTSSSFIGVTRYADGVRSITMTMSQHHETSHRRLMTSVLLLQEEPEESRDASVDAEDVSLETLSVSSEEAPPTKKWKPPKVVLQVFEFINLLWA
jgi:hypothetical protein